MVAVVTVLVMMINRISRHCRRGSILVFHAPFSRRGLTTRRGEVRSHAPVVHLELGGRFVIIDGPRHFRWGRQRRRGGGCLATTDLLEPGRLTILLIRLARRVVHARNPAVLGIPDVCEKKGVRENADWEMMRYRRYQFPISHFGGSIHAIDSIEKPTRRRFHPDYFDHAKRSFRCGDRRWIWSQR